MLFDVPECDACCSVLHSHIVFCCLSVLFTSRACTPFWRPCTVPIQLQHEIVFTSQNLWLQSDDQGLVNTDPRNIAVPDTFINNIPTDIRGLTFSRTPQQLINMYSLGNPSGIGPFFPNGLVGAINSPVGYANMATGLEDFPASPMDAFQVGHCAVSAWTQHMLTDKTVADACLRVVNHPFMEPYFCT